MPESDPKVVNDIKSRQSSAAHSARSRAGTATTASSSRPVSRINTASSRRSEKVKGNWNRKIIERNLIVDVKVEVVTRSGRRSKHSWNSSSAREELSGENADRSADDDSDDEDFRKCASSEFLDFGGLDIYNDEGWDTDLEAEAEVAKSADNDVPGRQIYIDACKIDGVIPVSFFLRHMTDSSLDLRHHGLGADGMRPLAVALVMNTSILKLNLDDNWLDVEGGRYVCEMLSENCYITDIDLSNNHLGVEFAQQFVAVVVHNSTVTHVTLAGNNLNDRAADYLAEAIMSTSHIEYLDLRNNKLGEAGGIALGPALAENSSIRYLDLSWNNIRRKGAVSIANGIKQNVLIQNLNLSWNGFAIDGAKALGEALKVNPVVEELDISNNRFTTEAAVLIGKGLAVNETLKSLKMGKNPMQSAGCFAICTAIVKNSGCILQNLDFSDILVNADFLELFKKVKEQLPDVKMRHGGDGVPARPKARVHPIVKLKNYLQKHSVRCAALFNDSEHTMLVPRSNFIKGLQSLEINLTPEDLEEIVDELDVNSAGDINYSGLILGLTDFTEKEKKMATTIQTTKAREEKVHSDY